MVQHCHKLIAKTAKEMAGEAYDMLASNNDFRRVFPNPRQFIKKGWKVFIVPARKALATILGGNYPEIMKEEVFEALVLDRSLQTLPEQAAAKQPLILH